MVKVRNPHRPLFHDTSLPQKGYRSINSVYLSLYRISIRKQRHIVEEGGSKSLTLCTLVGTTVRKEV